VSLHPGRVGGHQLWCGSSRGVPAHLRTKPSLLLQGFAWPNLRQHLRTHSINTFLRWGRPCMALQASWMAVPGRSRAFMGAPTGTGVPATAASTLPCTCLAWTGRQQPLEQGAAATSNNGSALVGWGVAVQGTLQYHASARGGRGGDTLCPVPKCHVAKALGGPFGTSRMDPAGPENTLYTHFQAQNAARERGTRGTEGGPGVVPKTVTVPPSRHHKTHARPVPAPILTFPSLPSPRSHA